MTTTCVCVCVFTPSVGIRAGPPCLSGAPHTQTFTHTDMLSYHITCDADCGGGRAQSLGDVWPCTLAAAFLSRGTASLPLFDPFSWLWCGIALIKIRDIWLATTFADTANGSALYKSKYNSGISLHNLKERPTM